MEGYSNIFYVLCFITISAEALQGEQLNSYASVYKVGVRAAFQSKDSHEFGNIVVDEETRTAYVGGVNYIYALDSNDVETVKEELHIPPADPQVQRCISFLGNAEICQNNIRVLHTVNSTTLYACGTMSYSPTCVYVDKNEFREISPRIKGGDWENPYDSLTVSTMFDDTLFAATSDLSPTSDDCISKSMDGGSLKTLDKDSFWLSEPHFVSAFNVLHGYGQDKVYVLFRENAEEFPKEFLAQEKDIESRIVYSRVATICKNDKGGNTWILNNKFATFTKMRIACPSKKIVRGKRAAAFYYDEIQNSFLVPNPKDPSNPTLYAIFTVPGGSVEATATCTYNLRDIEEALSGNNRYWNPPGYGKTWFTEYDDSFGPAPGKCVHDTTTLSNDRLSFSKKHPIKYGIIMPAEGHAIYQDAGNTFSHIVVDRLKRIERRGKEDISKEYDVVHYVTDSGFIKRVVYSAEARDEHWDIPSRQVFNGTESEKILTVKISGGFLYFGTNSSVIQLSIASCDEYKSCNACASARDPYCTWNPHRNKCVLFDPDIPLVKYYNGHVGSNDTKCPQPGTDFNTDSKKSSSSEDPRNFAGKEPHGERMNNTMASPRENNSEVAKCVQEKAELKKNYTALSTLILRYDTTRRLAIQLYRNTIYSLHKCQHKEAVMIQRLRDEENARKKVIVEGSPPKNETTRICENVASDAKSPKTGFATTTAEGESQLRKCDRQKSLLTMKHTRATKSLEARIESLETENGRRNRSLASCLSEAASLKSRNDDLERSKKNLTRQKNLLQRQYENTHKMVERLKGIRRRSGCKGASRCEQGIGWLYNEDTQSIFFLTTKMTTYDVGRHTCEGDGALLLTQNSARKMRPLQNFYEYFLPDNSQFWIGLTKYENGTLRWNDGMTYDESSGPVNFLADNEEKLVDRNSYCATIDTSGQRWELVACDKLRQSLCEMHIEETEGEMR